jgi:nucleoside 2-deoxyribosyltransferase
MVNKCVYLAGPIGGLTYDEATKWRDHVTNELGRFGIKCLSPLRAAIHLRHADGLLGDCEIQAGTKPAVEAMSTPKGVVTRDKFDATHCDVLLVNLLEAKKVSIGTCVEIGWANALNIPIIVVMEADNIHSHAFVRESASFITESLSDSVYIVKAILKDY